MARKKKVDVSILPPPIILPKDSTVTGYIPVNLHDDAILSILSRLCHACYDMDAHSEPWVSINRDIEELRK
jgi:hypothetical protein